MVRLYPKPREVVPAVLPTPMVPLQLALTPAG